MRNNDLDLVALLTKGLSDLRARFDKLAREPGPPGKDGRDGADGRDGKKGRDGKDGATGAQGAAGPQGERGPRGPKGERGERGPMPDHEWQGTKLRFEKPGGGWGEFVELRGPKGARGDRGASGGGGGSPVAPPFDINSLPAATDAAPAEFLVQQGGQWVRASYAQMQDWLGAAGVGITRGVLAEDGAWLLTEDGSPVTQE